MDLWIFLDTKKTGWCICGTAHTFILQAEDRRNICAQQWVRNVCLVWQWWALKMIFVNIFPIMTSLISLLQRELGRCLSLRTSPLDNVRGYVSLNFNNVCARMLVCFEWRFFFSLPRYVEKGLLCRACAWWPGPQEILKRHCRQCKLSSRILAINTERAVIWSVSKCKLSLICWNFVMRGTINHWCRNGWPDEAVCHPWICWSIGDTDIDSWRVGNKISAVLTSIGRSERAIWIIVHILQHTTRIALFLDCLPLVRGL